MATYDLTEGIPSHIRTGDILNCPYSGKEISIALPKGTYKFECWGGRGGIDRHEKRRGGNGGYSVGTFEKTSKSQIIYLVSGGRGEDSDSRTLIEHKGGYNGGGSGYMISCGGGVVWYAVGGASGGGATHIGLKSGLLSTFKDDYSSQLLMVAGGGGAANSQGTVGNVEGGNGGGLTGEDGPACVSGKDEKHRGYGATQTTAGANASYSVKPTESGFGVGGGYGSEGSEHPMVGGGAGFYGGGCSTPTGYSKNTLYGGGGGSGYINTTFLTEANTTQESTSTNPDSERKGYIRITVIKCASLNLKTKVSGSWTDVTIPKVKIGSEWKDLVTGYTKVNGVWKEST